MYIFIHRVQSGPVPHYIFFCLSARDTVLPYSLYVEILMAPGGKPSCLSPSVSLPTRRRTCSRMAASGAPDLGQSAWETGGLRSRRLRPHCMRTPSCMAFVVIGRGKRRP